MIPKITRKSYSTEDFSRYEFKYLLNRQQREVVEAEISNFMFFDGHVQQDLKNSYFVRSLYFDDDESANYYEKIDGVGKRLKFRIRTYKKEYANSVPIFLELKGRHMERTFKQRIAIKKEHIGLLTDYAKHEEFLNCFPGNWLAEKFVYEAYRKRLTPKVLVDYVRRPYTSEFDMNFRVTFDDRILAIATDQLFLNKTHWKSCMSGKTILEIKFHRRIPAWFHRILQLNDMRRLSISKFCKGMEACNLAIDLS